MGSILIAGATLAVWWPLAEAAPPPPPWPDATGSAEPAATATAIPNATPAAPSTARVEADGGFWVRSLEERAEPPLRASDPATAAALTGRLTVRQRPWLHPAGLEVRLVRCWLDSVLPVPTGDGPQTPGPDDVTTTTDADGRFLLRFHPPAGELFFLIDHRGTWRDFRKVPNVPHDQEVLDLGEVLLEDRGGIAGRVVDQGGSPFAGVTVRAIDDPLLDTAGSLDEVRQARSLGLEHFSVPGSTRLGALPDWVVRRDRFLPFPTTTTDAEGHFELTGVRPGVHDVFVTGQFAHGVVQGVQVGERRTTELGDVTLRGDFPQTIRCIDDHGRPWIGAEIAALDAELGYGAAVQRTDAAGEVTFAPFEAGRTVIAFAYPGGGPWVRCRLRDRRDLVVPRPVPVAIRLFDTASNPVRNGRVRFYQVGEVFRPTDRLLPAGLQPAERADGAHAGLWACPAVAVASAPGFAPAMLRLDQAADQDVTMLPLASMTVRTIDSDGHAVPHATVRVQVHQNPELTFPGAQWEALANDRAHVGTTGDDGTLTVPIWDTFLSLQAEHPAYGPSPGPKVRPFPGQRIDLLLRRHARVEGTLRFHRAPAAAGYRVRAHQVPPPGHELAGSGWLAEQLAVTGADGRFAFRGLCAGIWELQPELPAVPEPTGARTPGNRWKPVQVMLAEGQEFWLELEAEETALGAPQLTGTVCVDDVPFAGALVRVREAQGTRQNPKDRRRPSTPTAEPAPLGWTAQYTTDASGSFTFADLSPGTDHELRVDLPILGRLQFLERRIVRTPPARPTAPTPIAIAVATGTLQLTTVERGAVAANRMLRLRQIGPDGGELARFDVLTGGNGLTVVDHLPAGKWTAEPATGGYCRPAEFDVAAGGVAAANVEFFGR